VHHGDLDLGYGPGNWPADFVTVELDLVAADLGRRLAPRAALRIVATDGLGEWRAGPEDGEETLVGAPGGQLLAWLLGRPTTIANPPEIGPWQ
jgi:maleylpyruvate isomerase